MKIVKENRCDDGDASPRRFRRTNVIGLMGTGSQMKKRTAVRFEPLRGRAARLEERKRTAGSKNSSGGNDEIASGGPTITIAGWLSELQSFLEAFPKKMDRIGKLIDEFPEAVPSGP